MNIFKFGIDLPKKVEVSGVISRVSLSRNVEGIPFPNRATAIWSDDLKKRLWTLYQNYLAPKKFQWVELDKLNRNTLENFFFQSLIPKGVLDKPKEKILIYLKRKGILVNYQNHLQIFSVTSGLNLYRIYQEVDQLDNLIEGTLDYAFDDEWGYLTSSIDRLGTGMDLSIIIHLPALSLLYGEERFAQWLRDKDLQVKNYCGEDGIIGHIYHFSNLYSLGLSEWQIVDNLKKFGNTLIKWEKQIRETLKNTPSRYQELEESVIMRGRQLYRSDSNSIKDVFDFLSLWALGWQCGIFSAQKGLKLIEVKEILQKIWSRNLGLKKECLNILRFFRVISGEELRDV